MFEVSGTSSKFSTLQNDQLACSDGKGIGKWDPGKSLRKKGGNKGHRRDVEQDKIITHFLALS